MPSVKKQTTLLRHGHVPREDDGAIEFWRIQEFHRNDLVQCRHWSDAMWKSTMQKAEEKDFNIVLINQDKKFFISDQDAISLILH